MAGDAGLLLGAAPVWMQSIDRALEEESDSDNDDEFLHLIPEMELGKCDEARDSLKGDAEEVVEKDQQEVCTVRVPARLEPSPSQITADAARSSQLEDGPKPHAVATEEDVQTPTRRPKTQPKGRQRPRKGRSGTATKNGKATKKRRRTAPKLCETSPVAAMDDKAAEMRPQPQQLARVSPSSKRTRKEAASKKGEDEDDEEAAASPPALLPPPPAVEEGGGEGEAPTGPLSMPAVSATDVGKHSAVANHDDKGWWGYLTHLVGSVLPSK